MNATLPAETAFPSPPPIVAEHGLSAAQWGMISYLVSEVAFFSTLIATYVTFIGADQSGPTPDDALSFPLVIGTTICLLSSSAVIHLAEQALARGEQRKFCLLWGATIALGVAFLAGTAIEWRDLIVDHGLTIGRNLFGTTYYTLVGFHGLHVAAGAMAMSIVLGLALRRKVTESNQAGVRLVAWYWHFVDAVWVVVFLVVYVAGKSGVS
jgi:cytochrome c oxidase subunit 3/cytochrome o ubiquinol oxidase subunit 3